MPRALTPAETILLALRKLIVRSESKPEHMTTPTSTRFRRKASQLAKQAENEPDAERMLALMQQAITWVHLAENEETLSISDNLGSC
jgi:hypothetical protein